MQSNSTNPSSKTDVLSEASALLSQPSKNTKRKILIAVNLTFVSVAILHWIIQLVQFGKLPDPARDLIILPLLVLINGSSAFYNLKVLFATWQGKKILNDLTGWATVIFLQLMALAVVHNNINTATSILEDFAFSAVIIFITGTVLNRTAAVVWFFVCIVSLYMAFQNRGTDFEYHLMTKQEVIDYETKLKNNDPQALKRLEVTKQEKITPLPISLYATVWFIFLLLTFLPTYFEGGMIGQILKVIPLVIKKIQIAGEQKNQLERENMRMGMELDVARQIQTMILPFQGDFDQCQDLEVAARMDTATEVGGDFYEVLPQADGSTYFGIGDVTDHGLQSGIVMLMTQSAIRSLLDGGHIKLQDALNQINMILYKNIQDRMNDRRNLTLSLLHYANGKVRITGQHESVILLRHNEATAVQIDTLDLGMYVGLTNDAFEDYVQELSFDFNKGDIMLLYTDGATEAENEKQELYGIHRLMAVVEKHRNKSSKEIINEITKEIYQFIGQKQLLDDISLVIVKRHLVAQMK
jgi:serine phosphatase RsbU (regulator of sigma subunit)